MRRKTRYKRTTPVNGFWQSYSDMMAALLLVFVLVLMGTMFQAKSQFENDKKNLENYASEIAEKEIELQEKESELEEAEKIIKEQQANIKEILDVRTQLIEALGNTFTDEEVIFDKETGSISFNSDLLFEFDKDYLKDDGKKFLDSFMKRYIDMLLYGNFKEYVEEITIEGHADKNGSYIYNLDLSQRRALAVAKYCLEDSQKMFSGSKLENVREHITANGESWSHPIKKADGSIDNQASRRVEIRFRLKYEEMIQRMINQTQE